METIVPTKQVAPFLITKAAQLVVAEPEPEPEADKARFQSASGTLGTVAQALDTCVRDARTPELVDGLGRASTPVGLGSLLLGFLPGAAALQAGSETGAMLLGALGVLGLGAATALHLIPPVVHAFGASRRASDTMDRQGGNAALFEHITADLPPLERAFLARRAAATAAAAKSLDVPEAANRPAVLSLDQAASYLGTVSPAVRADSAALLDAYDGFFDAGNTPRRFWADAERLTKKIEELSPEARSLLLELVRDMVDAKMEDPGGQLFRVRRLRAALEGTTAPYAKSEDGADTELIDLVDKAIAECATKRPSEFCTTFEIRTGEYSQEDVPHSEVEPVAAHFEDLGYRVALYATPERIRITVYDPATPPDGIWMPSD